MRNLFLLTICLFAGIQLTIAQDISPILYSLSGKAKYLPEDGGKSYRLKPGDTLPIGGRLLLKKNTSMGIYYDYGYTYLNQGGTHSLAPMMKSSNLTESDVAEILGEQLIEVLHPYYQTIITTKSGFGSSGTTPVRPPRDNEADGHGDGDVELVRISPLGGKVAGNSITFSWEPKAEFSTVKNFTLTVMKQGNDAIYQENVTGTSITIDVATLGLQENTDYRWQVNATKDENINSAVTLFKYVSASEMSSVIESTRADECWIGANANTQLLIEASVLEANNFINSAESKFSEAYQASKKNPLAESLYKAFLWRYDLIKDL